MLRAAGDPNVDEVVDFGTGEPEVGIAGPGSRLLIVDPTPMISSPTALLIGTVSARVAEGLADGPE